MGGLICALAWMAGAGVQLQQARLWPLVVGVAMVLAALGLAVAGWRSGARGPRRVLLALACFLMAWGSTDWRAHQRLAAVLPAALEGQDLVLTGVVASLPQASLSGVRFQFLVESAAGGGAGADGSLQVPERVSLGWFRGFDADALLAAPALELRAGQRWRLPVRLRRPHGSLNPHGFDLELWMFEQGLGASGHVRAAAGRGAELLQEDAGEPVLRLRQRVRDAIFLEVADPVAAGVLAALVVGDQASIGREEWDLFRVTGVAHLMSISGLHVTMFAWLAAGVLGRLWRLHPALMHAVPAPMAARWGGLAGAAAYAAVAGWGVPAQRTVWMLATVVVVRSLGWRWPAWAVLAAAGTVVTAADPWALLQPGFWLSFVAVALLMASSPGGVEASRPAAGRLRSAAQALGRGLSEGLRTQAVATIGLAPLTLVFFQQLSLVGFVANLVAVPLVTFVVTPLGMLGVAWPALWSAAGVAVTTLADFLQRLAGWPLAVWQAAAAPAWAVAVGLCGGALAILPLPWRLRLLALPLFLPLLVPPVTRPAEGRFEAVVADVGQGTAVLVRTRRHLLVYDAGPQYSPESDAGQRVLLPLLIARGEAGIDRLMLSHRDTDHVGGARALLAHRRVGDLSSSLEPAHPLRQGGPPHHDCAAGQQWQWDGVRFKVLHPAPGEPAALAGPNGAFATPPRRVGATPNAVSCVLHVQDAQGRALLLTGDIEAMQELRLLEQSAPALRAEVMLVPHHGSRTSSTPGFIEAVGPRVAVAQAAYRSRFGHPAPDVVARYVDREVDFVRSDRCGAWTRHPDGTGRCQRQAAARYWHHADAQ